PCSRAGSHRDQLGSPLAPLRRASVWQPSVSAGQSVGGRGFEPLTPSASRKCSPPELTARWGDASGSVSRFRPSFSAKMGPLGANGRVKGVVSTARRRVDAAWAAVQERRPRVRSVDATLSAYERDRDRAGFLLAGALAYRLFLWLLPF